MALRDHMRAPLPLPLRPPTDRELRKRRQCVAVLRGDYWTWREASWLWWLKWLYERGRLCE
jgi:hypothetical protein